MRLTTGDDVADDDDNGDDFVDDDSDAEGKNDVTATLQNSSFTFLL